MTETRTARPAEWVCGCEAPDVELRFRIYANGIKHFHRQCLSCGDWGPSISQRDVPAWQRQRSLPADEEVRERRARERRAQWEREAEERNSDWQVQRREWERELEKKDGAWWERYEEYLRSEAWKKRKVLVLERDKGLCQSCLCHPATEVHHLTYRHVFREPLFDLASVCARCHRLITAMDREWRQKAGMRR